MKKVVTHLRHKNDTSGNPRRLWVVKGLNDGSLIAVYEDCYTGRPEDIKGPGYYDHGSHEITYSEYKYMRQVSKHLGVYHEG